MGTSGRDGHPRGQAGRCPSLRRDAARRCGPGRPRDRWLHHARPDRRPHGGAGGSGSRRAGLRSLLRLRRPARGSRPTGPRGRRDELRDHLERRSAQGNLRCRDRPGIVRRRAVQNVAGGHRSTEVGVRRCTRPRGARQPAERRFRLHTDRTAVGPQGRSWVRGARRIFERRRGGADGPMRLARAVRVSEPRYGKPLPATCHGESAPRRTGRRRRAGAHALPWRYGPAGEKGAAVELLRRRGGLASTRRVRAAHRRGRKSPVLSAQQAAPDRSLRGDLAQGMGQGSGGWERRPWTGRPSASPGGPGQASRIDRWSGSAGCRGVGRAGRGSCRSGLRTRRQANRKPSVAGRTGANRRGGPLTEGRTPGYRRRGPQGTGVRPPLHHRKPSTTGYRPRAASRGRCERHGNPDAILVPQRRERDTLDGRSGPSRRRRRRHDVGRSREGWPDLGRGRGRVAGHQQHGDRARQREPDAALRRRTVAFADLSELAVRPCPGLDDPPPFGSRPSQRADSRPAGAGAGRLGRRTERGFRRRAGRVGPTARRDGAVSAGRLVGNTVRGPTGRRAP